MPDVFNQAPGSGGLSDAEARARLKADGFNELPRSARRNAFGIARDVLREPMLAMLVGGATIYLFLGDVLEATFLLAFALLSVAITFVQEARTERVLEALRDLSSPRALVIRGGVRRRIAARDVVVGDWMVLTEGDCVPADGVLLKGQDVEVDESLLTGESVPVRKRPVEFLPMAAERPGGDDLPFVYSGALVVRGSGLAQVIAIGRDSEIGKIGQTLREMATEVPHLQRQTARLVRFCAVGGIIVSLCAVLLYGMFRGGWLEAFLAGIAISMSMLPEEFPVVLTVFMAMGAWRISKAHVLTRRAASIEALGAATVLCTDKTGTLTENRMRVVELRLPNGEVFVIGGSDPIPAPFRELAEYARLASAPEPVDPMEKAFHELARDGLDLSSARPEQTLIQGYGLQPDLLAMTQVWHEAGRAHYVVAAKGAPEAVAKLCRFGEERTRTIHAAVDAMAADGLRVLGVARAIYEGPNFPTSQRDFHFSFIGLVGLADPLRASVPGAIRECRSAGIRVVMITGDYPATARAIARQAGLDGEDILTGSDLERLTDAELAARVGITNIFARILPEQKLRVVQALKARGETVAMTGDGVNDAPSLRAAHIGVAMGGRGTDVAREAAGLVLLQDDFSSIVAAIRLGRRIYDNLRKAIGFIFAVHVPIAGLALLPLAFNLPLVFTPIHVAILEMVIDPVCSLAFEAEKGEKDLMRRPPRPRDMPLFSIGLVLWSFIQGAVVAALVFLVLVIAAHAGLADDEVRALTFVSLVSCIVSLILLNRSFSTSLASAMFRPNLPLGLIMMGVLTVLSLALLWPPASALLRFASLSGLQLAFALAVGVAALLVLEAIKPIWRPLLSR